MGGLAEVLAAHFVIAGPGLPRCDCGAPLDEFNIRADYVAHIESVVLAWLTDRLGSDEAREAVAKAVSVAVWGDYEPYDDWADEATAALTAVLGLLGGGT